MTNKYHYNSHTGFFNIYQARNGGIYLHMGNNVTPFTLTQLHDLSIDLYALPDFDSDAFNIYYHANTH